MKHILLLTALYLAVHNSATAQTQTQARKSTEAATSNGIIVIRSRVIDDPAVGIQVGKPATETTGELTSTSGDTAVSGGTRRKDLLATDGREPAAERASSDSSGPRLIQQTSMAIEGSTVTSSGPDSDRPVGSLPLNSIYRVGVGDVLDIRLLDLPGRESTLFTVLKGGIIEYPLIAEPLKVEGLRTPEIALAVAKEIRVIQAPQITVTVRDYASHIVNVTGLVEKPGSKILRREAMPVYAILAEALPRSDASIVTITRADGKVDTVSINDSQAMSGLVFSGDAIKVSNKPAIAKRFLYVGGDVTSPGEKEYREGITLTQLLLACGSTLHSSNTVTVARPTSNGFLTTTQYDLSMIRQGQVQDPVLESGDRIEVMRRTQ